MIDKFEDLGLPEEATLEEVQAVIEEQLKVKFSDLKELLNTSLRDSAANIASNFMVITPFGDYSKLLEDQPAMTEFLRTKAAQTENWIPYYIGLSQDPKLPNMLQMLFLNKAVDEGEEVVGYIFLNYEGKVLHAFVHGEA
jgi:hypothetical protein